MADVTDKDREAAKRCACAKDREEVSEAIAQAREEATRVEREACAEFVRKYIGGDSIAAAIRARGGATHSAADAASEV